MNLFLRRITIVAAMLALVLALPAVASAKRHQSPRDRNHDGIPDKWAKRFHVGKPGGDPDKDGLSNLGEFLSGTNPRVADTNHNGVSDASEDPDHDGVDNSNEVREHTNPRAADTNHNGVKDGKEDSDKDGLNNAGEQAAGTDPMNSDSDGDGIKDGSEHAGEVVSFDGTTLTLRLFGGATLTGTVDDNTFIDCGQDNSGSSDGSTDGSGDGSSTDPAADGWVDEPVDGKVLARDGVDPAAGDGSADPGADDPGADDGSSDTSDDPGVDDGSTDGTDTSGDSSGGCVPTDTLKPGVAVDEADVSYTSDGASFDAIELAH